MTSTSLRKVSGKHLLSQPLPVALRDSIGQPDYLDLGTVEDSTVTTIWPTVFVTLDKAKLAGMIDDEDVQAVLEEFQNPMELEPGQVLLTEADVERAAHSYLMHHIHIIFQDYLDMQFPGMSLRCDAQMTRDSGRTDVIWTVLGITIAVMELKNCHALRTSDWTPHILQLELGPTPTAQQRSDEIIKKCGNFLESDEIAENIFNEKNNCKVLSIQAAKYAKTHFTPVVVLFDWLNMILLDFQPEVYEGYKPDWNESQWMDHRCPVEIMFAADEAEDGWNMSKTLLAALIFGFNKCFSEGKPVEGRKVRKAVRVNDDETEEYLAVPGAGTRTRPGNVP
ncbi:hypothetical protein R3P38DRAFT_3341090 [Favolaschia claudopus]|uniref:Uncharacterized protein n=1 Tax=Favolaschia claudopus TaxID=2862362 RepID=A0AAW0EBI7_9AGAR